ncbi:MAG TPA: hypothetical protein DCO79_08325 [Spirochaeta sp.]|nr:hypothetical protein [Spirochaeta sp.]
MNKETDHLTGLILNWQKHGTGYSEIIRETSEFVIDYPRRCSHWDRDKCSEFYIYFYRRLIKLIDNFDYQGISFKALLKNTIAWQMSSFYRQKKSSVNMDYCIRYDSVIQAEAVCDCSPERKLGLTEDAKVKLRLDCNGRIGDARICKRLLMLALKNANYLNEEYIGKISEITGCSRGWLSDAVYQIRSVSEYRRDRLETYRIRANKAYLELCQIHRELGLTQNICKQQELEKKLRTIKKRMTRACRSKDSVLMNPTNYEVAEIMRVPKGSIDSGLYLLRKTLSVPAESGDA